MVSPLLGKAITRKEAKNICHKISEEYEEERRISDLKEFIINMEENWDCYCC